MEVKKIWVCVQIPMVAIFSLKCHLGCAFTQTQRRKLKQNTKIYKDYSPAV